MVGQGRTVVLAVDVGGVVFAARLIQMRNEGDSAFTAKLRFGFIFLYSMAPGLCHFVLLSFCGERAPREKTKRRHAKRRKDKKKRHAKRRNNAMRIDETRHVKRQNF